MIEIDKIQQFINHGLADIRLGPDFSNDIEKDFLEFPEVFPGDIDPRFGLSLFVLRGGLADNNRDRPPPAKCRRCPLRSRLRTSIGPSLRTS
jgi:hypothetical protein